MSGQPGRFRCEAFYRHSFGVGTSLEMVRALRGNDRFVDSIDISTPERAVKNGRLPDKTWTQSEFGVPASEDSSSVRAQYSAAVLYQLNYMLLALIDDDILDVEYERTCLDGFEDIEREHSDDDNSRSEGSVESDHLEKPAHDDDASRSSSVDDSRVQRVLSAYSG